MRTRIILGTLLAILAVGMFVADHFIGPQAPVLGLVSLALAAAGSLEFRSLIPAVRRPSAILTVAGCAALIATNWVPLALPRFAHWLEPLRVFAALVLLAMINALASYREPGESTNRLALTVFALAYLGLFPGFLVSLRTTQPDAASGTAALLLAVFVPKCCDIGAYFTGRAFGRHKMSPVLSPKKTWEGLAGGLAFAAGTAVAIQAWNPIIPFGWPGAVAFGLVVGGAGVLGDLAESLLKRDSGAKDASQLLPEFGGVLDLVDAILFAAPVVYLWLK